MAGSEAAFHPPKEAAGCVLCKRVPALVVSDGNVRVGNNGGWEEDRRARGKLNHLAEVPQNQMSTFFIIEGAEWCHGAHPRGLVSLIRVDGADGARAKVVREPAEDGRGEYTNQVRVSFVEGVDVFSIVVV